jgi:hypothetical protein
MGLLAWIKSTLRPQPEEEHTVNGQRPILTPSGEVNHPPRTRVVDDKIERWSQQQMALSCRYCNIIEDIGFWQACMQCSQICRVSHNRCPFCFSQTLSHSKKDVHESLKRLYEDSVSGRSSYEWENPDTWDGIFRVRDRPDSFLYIDPHEVFRLNNWPPIKWVEPSKIYLPPEIIAYQPSAAQVIARAYRENPEKLEQYANSCGNPAEIQQARQHLRAMVREVQ